LRVRVSFNFDVAVGKEQDMIGDGLLLVLMVVAIWCGGLALLWLLFHVMNWIAGNWRRPDLMVEIVLCLVLIAALAGILCRYKFCFFVVQSSSRYYVMRVEQRSPRIVICNFAYSNGRVFGNFN
jgi:hypothetical protein